jgi:hypothetical protein
MKKGSIYSLHPGFAMQETSMRNLKERTGKTVEEWVETMRRDGPEGDNPRKEWLKSEHGFTTNYAAWVVGWARGDLGAEGYDPESYVEELFSGKKAGLRPIYDELLQLGFAQGGDVKVCPCSTMVPIYRKNVFGQIKPATNTRIDLGLCLRGVPADSRLISTGGEAKGDRITHRIPISSVEEIDDHVRYWLKRAYDAAGLKVIGER